MKISIITAVYNRAATVAEALASVQGQSWQNIEHVIQDGGSTDGTLEIIHSVRNPRINLVSMPDDGIYDAINRGIERATGDVIGLMHSDDVFANDTVVQQVAETFEDPQVDCVYGDLQYVAAHDVDRVIRHWTSGPYKRDLLRHGWMPPHPTFYIRSAMLERLGNYDTSFQIAADYDAMLRWLWTGHLRAAYIPQVMVKMRVGGESNRSLSRILRKSTEDYRALRNNGVGGVHALMRKNIRKISQFRL
ncbi:glycosyltransferase family 2 protein [Roseobacter sp.]|uniref:glycosyltransferase family 2 protein n=1 Tax=Roseobacter sp. TaxID=1907202 RepID=UPI00385F0EE1